MLWTKKGLLRTENPYSVFILPKHKLVNTLVTCHAKTSQHIDWIEVPPFASCASLHVVPAQSQLNCQLLPPNWQHGEHSYYAGLIFLCKPCFILQTGDDDHAGWQKPSGAVIITLIIILFFSLSIIIIDYDCNDQDNDHHCLDCYLDHLTICLDGLEGENHPVLSS